MMKKGMALGLALAMALGVNILSASTTEAAIVSKAKAGIARIEVQNPVPVKILADYRKQGYSGVIDVGTYTDIDDEKMLAISNERLDGHAKLVNKACTAIVKPLDINGKRVSIMGRNMDLPTSHYPAYIFRINQPGKYKTINIGYLNNGIETFDQIAETSTIDKRMYTSLPYKITDAMNEKGLMVEANMRGTDLNLISSGTNPGKKRIADSCLARYLVDHCANIEEVLQTLKNLDVYVAHSEEWSWYTTLVIADATGRYGTLEFVKNRVAWHEGYPGQANFWIDKEARKEAASNMGYGRWTRAMQQYNHIKTEEDMKQVMASIHYGRFFYEDCRDVGYDIATEMSETDVAAELAHVQGWIKDYGVKVAAEDLEFLQKAAEEQKTKKLAWETAWVTDPDNQSTVYRVADIISECMKQLPYEAQKLSGEREMSSISYVANPVDKVYHVQFFETGKTFNFSFNGITAK